LTEEVAAPAPRPRKALRVFRGGVVVFYWITLPLALLAMGGWISSLFLVPGETQNWLFAVGSVGFCALLIWRLWLNSRALGRAGPFPAPRRFWRVFVPLGLLAFAGLCLAGLGMGAAIVGAAAFREAPPGAGPFAIGTAVFLITLGGGMCWPLVSRLLRRPPDVTPLIDS
jgi:hypothetical protein